MQVCGVCIDPVGVWSSARRFFGSAEYGLPLGVLYLLISKACVVTVFLLLHYEVLGGDVQAVLRLLGLERCMNVKV